MTRALGELELIERIRTGWGGRGRRTGLALGIGDDCAILRPPKGHELVVTTDFSLENRHFRREWHPAESVGWRALARGASDVAAMGAEPIAAFLSLAVPGDMMARREGRRWVERFFAGLRALEKKVRVPLAGGDTSESPCGLVLADIIVVGSVPEGKALRRSGGRAGDLLYVTGALGGSAAELDAMRRAGRLSRGRVEHRRQHPHLFPEPRVRVGLELVRRGLARAAIDLSDGLSTDLHHLCKESRVGAEVWASELPVHALACAGGDPLSLALNGGEDYELLFAAPGRIKIPTKIAGVQVTCIGKLLRGREVILVGQDGRQRALPPSGWQHFVTGKINQARSKPSIQHNTALRTSRAVL